MEHAANLKGQLMLVVPELDTNVDPASTMQVVNALVKAAKEFELVVIPGADHGAGSPITVRKRNDFFVKHLRGLLPPNWNDMPVNTGAGNGTGQDDEPDYESMEAEQLPPASVPVTIIVPPTSGSLPRAAGPPATRASGSR
jgi:hypothetical protein